MLSRLSFALLLFALLPSGSASAAVIQAFWSGQVTSADDPNAVIFQNAQSLIGSRVTLSITYDSSRARSISAGQSIDSSAVNGDLPAFISQSLNIGGQEITGFNFLTQSVRLLSFPNALDNFSNSGSSVELFNSIVTVRQLRAQIADFSNFIVPESLDEPFVWQGGPLQTNSGQLIYTANNFRENISLFSASAAFRWDSVTVSRVESVSPIPGPASGLLLITALVGGSLVLRRKRSAEASA